MYACPSCEMTVQDFETACPQCGVNLTLLARLNELPDAQFNRALAAARQNDWATASMMLGCVLAERMTDADAWLLWGLIQARRGLLPAAADCFKTVMMLRPGDPHASHALETIQWIHESRKPSATRNATDAS